VKVLYHFGQVLVLIEDKKRYTEYKLIHHPSLPENRLVKWKQLKPKRGLKKPAKNVTLDNSLVVKILNFRQIIAILWFLDVYK